MAIDSDSDGNLEITNPAEFRTGSVPPDTNLLASFNNTSGQPNNLEQIGAFFQRVRAGLALLDGSNASSIFLETINGASLLEDETFLGQLKATNQVADTNSDLINLGLLLGISQKELGPSAITAADEDDVEVFLTKEPLRNRYVYEYNVTDKILNIDITIDKGDASGDDGSSGFPGTKFATTNFRIRLFRHSRIGNSRGQSQSWVIAGSKRNMLVPVEEATHDFGLGPTGPATISVIQSDQIDANPLIYRISVPADATYRHYGMVSFEHL